MCARSSILNEDLHGLLSIDHWSEPTLCTYEVLPYNRDFHRRSLNRYLVQADRYEIIDVEVADGSFFFLGAVR
jgi:hypothetical protein